MSFQVCMKTDKTLQQLATEIGNLFSLPPFSETAFSGEPYCQFEMLGMLILIHKADEEDRDPEVMDYPYCIDLQMSFTDHNLNTDDMEYRLQPYYAQLLTFQLNLETAHHEKQKMGQRWQIRYHYYSKNPRWDSTKLYGEEGWESAVIMALPTPWRSVHHIF